MLKQLDNDYTVGMERFLYTRFFKNAKESVAEMAHLDLDKFIKYNDLVLGVLYREVPIEDVFTRIATDLVINSREAKTLALDVLGKLLLIKDHEWFSGTVSEEMKKLGGNPDDYATIVAEMKAATDKEIAEAEEKERVMAEEERREKEEEKQSALRKKEEVMPRVVTDPEGEKKDFREIFAKKIKNILISNNSEVKDEFTKRLTYLFLNDESGGFQRDILKIAQESSESLSADRMITNGEEKLPGTVGNWLMDYIRFVGIDDVANNLKRAQYLTNSPNARQLDEQTRAVLGSLLSLYANIKNFYDNVEKFELGDYEIFPLTEDERQELVEEKEVPEQGRSESVEPIKKEQTMGLAFTDEEESSLATEKAKLVTSTRKEFNKIADLLADHILNRRKFPILACLELLAETGALDNVLAADKRYQEYLFKYYDRNNLGAEKADFKINPNQGKHIGSFLKFVLLERLGMPEHEAARWAARYAAIFRRLGASQYSRLAYYDMAAEAWSFAN